MWSGVISFLESGEVFLKSSLSLSRFDKMDSRDKITLLAAIEGIVTRLPGESRGR